MKVYIRNLRYFERVPSPKSGRAGEAIGIAQHCPEKRRTGTVAGATDATSATRASAGADRNGRQRPWCDAKSLLLGVAPGACFRVSRRRTGPGGLGSTPRLRPVRSAAWRRALRGAAGGVWRGTGAGRESLCRLPVFPQGSCPPIASSFRSCSRRKHLTKRRVQPVPAHLSIRIRHEPSTLVHPRTA